MSKLTTNKLTIVANIFAKEDKIELVQTALNALIEPTRLEQGCINYDLHQDKSNPTHFMFFENWQSRELWLEHMESEHLAQFKQTTKDALAAFTVNEMAQIG